MGSWSRTYASRQDFYADAVSASPAPSDGAPTVDATASDGASGDAVAGTIAPADASAVEQAQRDAARTAAQSIIESGAIGDGEVTVSLSGHANAAHKPCEGQGLEFVAITVAQRA